jgi:FkbM family methyltransferase
MKYRMAWGLTWPIREYIRHSPIHRGKGFLIRRAILPSVPPPPAAFLTDLPGGARVELYFRETLGYVTLIYGGFERAELQSVLVLAQPGTTAFDVGSNVGMFAVVMAAGVRDQGQVVAVEPGPANVRRLQANIVRNSATNIRIVEAAAADRDGSIVLHLAPDAAYHSVGTVSLSAPSAGDVRVRAVRLDSIWRDAGEPVVSMVKVDVEGAELPVLEGSREIIGAHHPALLVEARGHRELAAVGEFLASFGYERQIRPGYMPWNHLFLWNLRS